MNAYEIKNAIYSEIRTHMATAVPQLNLSSEYVEQVSKLPAMTFSEIDNSVYQRMSVGNIQNAVLLNYEINVFSNKVGEREEEARQIMYEADSVMLELGFTRTMTSPVPNFADATIYRLTARYEGVAVSEGTDSAPAYRIYQAHISQAKMR